MAYTNDEVRPLVGSRNNPSHKGFNHGGGQQQQGTRRRTGVGIGPQQQQFYSSNSVEDFTKQTDRRSVLSKCCSSVSGFVCARPDTDTKIEYYEDTYNDEPWECTFGTSDQDGIWVNYTDKVGQIMSSMVWVLITYSVLTISLLAHNQNLPNSVAMVYATICTLALASHVKTMFTDPGSIPREAVPRAELFTKGITTHAMCSHCQTYKPPQSHHCRICNRCISRMDHHCPWMNNCVGANNFSKLLCSFVRSFVL
jgi:hypothetical protein